MTIIAKRNELANILELIKAKQAEIDGFEYESSEDEFDSHLDSCYDDVTVAGCTFSASQILSECDPTAYRCYKVDYDSEKDLDDVPAYAELVEELEALQEQRDDLEVEIEELEEENEE